MPSPMKRENRLNGLFPLSYLGVVPVSPNNIISVHRAPTINDRNYNLGQLWINTANNHPPDSEDIYMLISLAGGRALWQSLGLSVLRTLTSNSGGAVGATNHNINVVGDGTTIIGVGNPGTSTITLSAAPGGTLSTLTGNSGGPVSPLAGNINLVGSGAVSVSGNPGTHTLTISAPTVATTFTANTGSAVPALNNLNIFGSPTPVIATTASGSTMTTNIVNGNNGQLIIGGGSNAAWANITSLGGTVTITNGPNTINLEVNSTVNVLVFTTSGTYTPSTGMTSCLIEVIGGGGGGGGCTGSLAANQWSVASAGGSGGYAKNLFNAATIGGSQVVTVGAGGAGGAAGNNPGTAGGTSSVGALISATGGAGGPGGDVYGMGAPTSPLLFDASAGGSGIGGYINMVGGYSTYGLMLSLGVSLVALPCGAGGGISFYGAGSGQEPNFGTPPPPPNDGLNYGSGGGGAATANTLSADIAGGNGADGIVIITEFIRF